MLSEDKPSGNVPRYNIAAVMAHTDRLHQALDRFTGQFLRGEAYERFSETLCAELLANDIGDSKTIELSCRPVLGKILDDKTLNTFCWRISGNLDNLRNFRPVTEWVGQISDEWMPLEIVDCNPVPNTKKPSFSVVFRVLAGSAASMLCRKVWSKRFFFFVSRSIGFTRPDKKHPFKDPSQFVGLRLFGLFEGGKSSIHTGPLFEKVYIPSGLLGYNKILIAKRARTYPGFSCPAGFNHPCHLCFVGYDRCPMGTHPRTYEKRECQSCGEVSWFDPKNSTNKTCVNCSKSPRTNNDRKS